MRRSVHLASAVLAALTAVALLGAAVALPSPAVVEEADGPRDAANRALAINFYDAANAAIATGDATRLEALVAPDFVDRSIAADAGPDRDGLVRRLLAVHAANPGVRLGVEALAADGEIVIAAVRVDGADAPTMLGLRLGQEWTAWGRVDVFRLAGGRIVERRGAAADPAPLTPEVRAELTVPPPDARNLTATRFRLAPGAHHTGPGRGGPRLVVAEDGAVEVAPIGQDPASPVVLRDGEHLVLAAGVDVTFRHTGRSPATLLEVAIVAVPFGDTGSRSLSDPEAGVAVEVLANDLLIAVPAKSVVLSAGRVTLEAGERLGWSPAAGPVLLHVEAGALELTATGSVPWVDGTVGQRSAAGIEAAMSGGGGALLEAGAAGEIRAAPDGPATLTLLTLLPAEEAPRFDGAASGTG